MISRAKREIGKRVGGIINTSSLYETEPWGYEDDHPYLNQVIYVESGQYPTEVLDHLLEIESELGRTRKPGCISGRKIDIDILFYSDLVMDSPLLTIPHPRLHLRRFTLVPLFEIGPGILHPVFNKTVKQLLDECEDRLEVKKYCVDS